MPSSSVTVEVNDTHRVKVIVTGPGMLLSEIVQAAVDDCLKKRLLQQAPTGPCVLKYKGKKVDQSIPWRLSGIANLATLAVSTINSAAPVPIAKVKIRFQSPEGAAQGAFLPSTTLQAALDALATVGSIDLEEHAPLAPVLSMDAIRVSGAALASSTFQSAFNIVSGSALLQLTFEQTKSDSVTEPMHVDPPTPAPGPAPGEGTVQAQRKKRPAPATIPPSTKPVPTLSLRVLEERLRDFREELSVETGRDGMGMFCKSVGILIKYMRNVQNSSPDDTRPRAVTLENKTFSENIAKWRTGGLLFEALGWQLQDDSPMIYLRAEHPRFTADALQLFQSSLAQAQPQPGNTLAPAIVPSRNQTFGEDTMPQNLSPAMEAHAKPDQPTLTEMRVAKLKADKLIPLPERDVAGFDRELRIQTADQLSSGGDMDVCDADFQMDASMAKALLNSYTQDAGGDSFGGQSFKTKAWKELEQLEKIKSYEKTVIRVRFPDNAVLQASFHPRERLSKLWQVIQQVLVGEPEPFGGVWSLWDPSSFPAKKIEQDRLKLTFARERMQPRAVLDLRWDALGKSCLLKPELLGSQGETAL